VLVKYEKKVIHTSIYRLQSEPDDNKGFGYVHGRIFLPEYTTEIKVHLNNEKFNSI